MVRILLCLLFVSAAFAAPAYADGMRCGQKLIQDGDSKPEVLSKCGEPAYKEVISGANDIREEIWIYDRGPGQLDTILTFRGIRLLEIEFADLAESHLRLGGGSMRCGQNIIEPGETKLEVQRKCGEPEFRERTSGANFPGEEVWSYPAGREAWYILYFRGVILIEVKREF